MFFVWVDGDSESEMWEIGMFYDVFVLRCKE